MAELRERLEALERRMERAEAALRDRTPAALRLHAVPVRFEEVAVRFSRREWDTLDEGQRELYRSVMEGNYEMLVSLYCALSKPDLLLWLEREELSTLTESKPKAADVSPEPAVELAHPSCSRGDGMLEAKTTEPGEGSCREPEESRNLAEESENLVEESGNLAEEDGNPSEESGKPAEKSGSPAVPENYSTHTEVGVPMEVPQEEVTVEKPIVPETSSEGPEEEKGLEQEDVEDSGNAGQGPAADIHKEPGKADSVPEKPEKGSCVGRPAACQRNATREFYSCPICSKSFLLKINFLIHQHGHSNSTPYICVHCDREFMSKKKIRRHLRATSGMCQPSEPEPCPSRTPCPTSQPQPQVANGTCQPLDAQVCPRQVPCPTSQPQALVPNGTGQPSEPGVCPSQTLHPTLQPQTWAANGTCQPPEAQVCPTSQPQICVANGTCQGSKPEECPRWTPCPTSQPQTWAASGICQPLNQPEACPSGTPCLASQPQALSRDCGVVWEKPSPAGCPLSPGKMLYTCSECLENFSSQSFLTVHQRWHSGRHRMLCPCCNQRFTCMSDFVRQHWAHTGVRPHQCGICQKTFKRFSHLKEHRRTHMRQNRPLPCAKPVPILAGTVPGDGVGSQGVTSQGCCAAAGP